MPLSWLAARITRSPVMSPPVTLEEWMERSGGKIRADVAHEKLLALGYGGSERTTRRAVARVRAAFRAGRVRVHRGVGDRAGHAGGGTPRTQSPQPCPVPAAEHR